MDRDRNRHPSDPNRPVHILDTERLTTPGLTPGTGMRRSEPAKATPSGGKSVNRIGYGLPCAKCGTYYTADLKACPVCQSAERVSAELAPAAGTAAEVEAAGAGTFKPQRSEMQLPENGEGAPDDAQVIAERERFIREYKAKLFATHKLNATVTFHCTLEHNHLHGYEPAAVCKGCYEEMEQKADRLDAALRMDLKEATQIIYDAVWADPTPGDPGRTYRNAAEALLVELRRRAGTTLLLGSLKPYSH